MLRTLQAPPQLGSLREWVIILLLNKLEDIEHARFRASAQLIVDKEAGVTAFEDYMRIAFPYLEGRKNNAKKEAHAQLMSWVKEGPMKVTPMETPGKQGKSRLKARVVARMAAKEQQEAHKVVVEQWKKQKGL